MRLIDRYYYLHLHVLLIESISNLLQANRFSPSMHCWKNTIRNRHRLIPRKEEIEDASVVEWYVAKQSVEKVLKLKLKLKLELKLASVILL